MHLYGEVKQVSHGRWTSAWVHGCLRGYRHGNYPRREYKYARPNWQDTSLISYSQNCWLVSIIFHCFQNCNISIYHIWVWPMSSWISFVRSVQGRKFNRIPDEKYGLPRPKISCQERSPSEPHIKGCTDCIVKHPVQVPFIRLDLHAPSMNISSCVCWASLWANGGNAQKHFAFLSDSIEETGRSDISAIISAFEFPVCSIICVRQGWWF